jgi:hypothetical protein
MDMDASSMQSQALRRTIERHSARAARQRLFTRMLLAGIIKENVAVNLVFDMHNEYAGRARTNPRPK